MGKEKEGRYKEVGASQVPREPHLFGLPERGRHLAPPLHVGFVGFLLLELSEDKMTWPCGVNVPLIALCLALGAGRLPSPPTWSHGAHAETREPPVLPQDVPSTGEWIHQSGQVSVFCDLGSAARPVSTGLFPGVYPHSPDQEQRMSSTRNIQCLLIFLLPFWLIF